MPRPDFRVERTVRKDEYNALRDPNMRLFFENRGVQMHLYKTGQIDRDGRVIDLDRNNSKSKLHIIEQELRAAEKLAYWRMKEEEEMRHRVQQKRHESLARIRRTERLVKMKEDRRIRSEIIAAARGTAAPLALPPSSSRKHLQNSNSVASFVTDAPSRADQFDLAEG